MTTINFDDDLDGLLAPGNAQALYELAATVPADLAIVEIGAFRGASTVALALGAKSGHGARVWSIDPWDLPGNAPGRNGQYVAGETRERYDAQLRRHKVRSHVTTIQAFSNDAAADWAGSKIGLLFVDGDHSYEGVRTDIDAWAPHLAHRHKIAFDDYGTPKNLGVKQAVDELNGRGYPDAYEIAFYGTSLAVAFPHAR